MPRFTYTALSEAGAQTTGTVEADSQPAALRILAEKRLYPISVKGDSTTTDGKPKTRRVKAADLGMLYSKLADLLGSGVPLLR